MRTLFFHRNLKAGYSINKVTQTVISGIPDKKEYYVPYVGASLKAIFGNILYVWRHRDPSAVHHITGDIHYCMLALIGCKSVLTIHDTVSLDFNQLPKFKKLLMEWLWFRLPLRFATKVVCISESTKEHVQRYTSRTDIQVIHNAIDPAFQEKIYQEEQDGIPTVLLIGTNPNKNLVRTFEALQGLKCKVVVIGHLSKVQKETLSACQINYVQKEGLTDAQIVKEYENCDIVSFISLFEGFGMIVIEANKVGRPVICSDIPVLREVAGDAALFVNPNDVEDMRNGFERLLSDSALRQLMIHKGFANVRRFDVSSIRQQWMALYDSIQKHVICVLATASAKRGALTIYNQFINALTSMAGPDEWHVFIDEGMPMPEINHVHYHVCHTKGFGRFWFDFVKFRKLLKQEGIIPDVVFSLQNTGAFCRASRTVIYYHQSLPLYHYQFKFFDKSIKENLFYSFFYPCYVRLFLNHKSFVAVQTETTKTLFGAKYKFPLERIGVYFPSTEKIDIHQVIQYSYEKDTYNFLYPSMGASYKEHITLAYALNILKSKEPDLAKKIRVHFTVEEGNLLDVEKYIVKNDLCDNFVFHGSITHQQVLSMLASSHGLLFPSVVESSGMPLIEAAELGVPIVANDMEYVYDSLSSYKGLKAVQIHDYQEWADRIRELCLNMGRYQPYVLNEDDSWKRLFVLIRQGEIVSSRTE